MSGILNIGSLQTLKDRLTAARAALLDNLSAYTTARGAKLDNLDNLDAQVSKAGLVPPTSIITRSSDGGIIDTALNIAAGKQILSGALTANTLKTVLSITGSGYLDLLQIASLDTTSRTLRLKLTLDGTVVYDATSSATTIQNSGMRVIGYSGSANSSFLQTRFSTSILVAIASSLSETDKISINCAYRLT